MKGKLTTLCPACNNSREIFVKSKGWSPYTTTAYCSKCGSYYTVIVEISVNAVVVELKTS